MSHPPCLYLDITRNNHGYYAELKNENEEVLAQNPFDYQLDNLTILTELEKFEPGNGDPFERINLISVFGQRLYQRVFSGEMQSELQKAIKDNPWLRFILRVDKTASGLEQIPWEFMHDGNDFIVSDEKMTLFRRPKEILPETTEPIEDTKIRILCFISSPLDLEENERLAVETEKERLMQALDISLGTGRVEIDFEDEATLENLESAFDEGVYHILHYTGHGFFHEAAGGMLILEDERGMKNPVGMEKLKFILEKGRTKGLRLVFLSGCQTAKTTGQEGFKDLARPFLSAGIPGVIAMQYSITDAAGIILAETFYRAIARGESIDAALNGARRRLLLNENYITRSDFATPVLFTTDPDCLQTKTPKLKPDFSDIKIDTAYHVLLQQLGVGFVGRRKELREIKKSFQQDGVRAIILHGIGGIGKTVTATQAARRLRKNFRAVYAFDCGAGTISSDQIITELHHFLSMNGVQVLGQLIGQYIPVEQKASFLAQVLTQYQILIIFDNMESVLDKETEQKIDNPDLAVFLKTLINNTDHGSKFLFTSRYTFHLLEDTRRDDEKETIGYRMQQACHTINLGDLSRPEAMLIINKFPSLIQAEWDIKKEIYRKLGGHPYALNIFARYCQGRSPKDVLDSLGEVTGEMARFAMLEKSWQALSSKAQTLLERISVFNKEIPLQAMEWVMGEELQITNYELQNYRERIRHSDDKNLEKLEEMSDEELKNFITDYLPKERKSQPLTNEIEELIHWGLLLQINEKEETIYNVHSLVRNFCKDKMDQAAKHKNLLDAAEFYLNLAKYYPKDTPMAVFTKLDARNLLFEACEYEIAGLLVNNYIQKYLCRWGFITLAEQLLKDSIKTTKKNVADLIDLANIYKNKCIYNKAHELYNQCLKILEDLDDEYNTCIVHHQLGILHRRQGEYEAAKEEFRFCEKICKKIDDREGLAYVHYEFGVIFQRQLNLEAALNEYQYCIDNFEDLKDSSLLAKIYCQIGKIYNTSSNYDAALNNYQLALNIAEEIIDKGVLINIHNGIGWSYYFYKNYELALKEFKISLNLSEEIDDKLGIAYAHCGIASINNGLMKYQEAFSELILALNIFIKLHSTDAQSVANDLIVLRKEWGLEEFDKAWRKATGIDVPNWLK